jgi:hypothetical protein
VDRDGGCLRRPRLEAGQLYQTNSAMPMTYATTGCAQNRMIINREVSIRSSLILPSVIRKRTSDFGERFLDCASRLLRGSEGGEKRRLASLGMTVRCFAANCRTMKIKRLRSKCEPGAPGGERFLDCTSCVTSCVHRIVIAS